MHSNRERGLCFHCDEKWGLGHQCKRRELQTLWMMVEVGEEDDEEPTIKKDGAM